MPLPDFFSQTIVAQNEVWRFIVLFAIIALAFLVGKVSQYVLDRTVKKLNGSGRIVAGAFAFAVGHSMTALLLTAGAYGGIQLLTLNDTATTTVTTIVQILLVCAIGYMLFLLVDVPGKWFEKSLDKSENVMNRMLLPVLRKSLRALLILLVLVQIAQILSNKPITSIVAGLGIGGLAFALAAQDTIKNLFGSLVLLADKPFVLGDRVVIDGHDGPVEAVGLRSTKVRTLEGHLVTVPNGELANKTILNIGKRPYIRRLFNIGITYDTPPDKVDRAVAILKEILDSHEGMQPDFPPRVYFNGFNEYSLNIMVIYWYHPPDYWAFCEFSERVNREILRRFNEEGIEFAFPTQTLFLADDKKRGFTYGPSSS
jgi:MscS family membrane protein